jgi:hypothetical protein
MSVPPLPNAAGAVAHRHPARLSRRTPAAHQGIALPARSAHGRGDRRGHAPARPGCHGARPRALIVLLSRAGLRIQEAPSLTEHDLEPRAGSVLVRHGKGGSRREVAIDRGASSSPAPGPSSARRCRSGRCRPSSTARPVGGREPATPPAPNRGASPRRPACGDASRRTSCATPTPSSSPTRAPLNVTQRQLGHTNLGTTSISARHRQRRDHRHRPRPKGADDPSQHQARDLRQSARASPCTGSGRVGGCREKEPRSRAPARSVGRSVGRLVGV